MIRRAITRHGSEAPENIANRKRRERIQTAINVNEINRSLFIQGEKVTSRQPEGCDTNLTCSRAVTAQVTGTLKGKAVNFVP
jgi:hypothetical protein